MNRFWQKQEEFSVGSIFFYSPQYSRKTTESIGVYSALLSSELTRCYSTLDPLLFETNDNVIDITDVRINEIILNEGFKI